MVYPNHKYTYEKIKNIQFRDCTGILHVGQGLYSINYWFYKYVHAYLPSIWGGAGFS